MNIFQKVTLKTLKENKTRTVVTIIGILLSLSMFTAVTTSVTSFFVFMKESTIAREGNWHGGVYSLTDTDVQSLQENDSIETVTSLESIGYAKLTDGSNPDKPYLYIGGIEENASDLLPLNLTQGRMPENSQEIILPEHLASNGNIQYKTGDTLSLDIGSRTSKNPDYEGVELDQSVPYLNTMKETATDENREQSGDNTDKNSRQSGMQESLTTDFSRTYTVVGFYERPSIEPYSAPGYTALTVNDGQGQSYAAFFRFYNPKDVIPWLDQHYPDGYDVNYELLRLSTASYESGYNSIVYSLAGILTAIILFGSISLIYNAFSISVSERTKQFGLLASLGATKKQLTRSVIFEAISLCCIGIPLGVLAGIAGIGITFHFTGGIVSSLLYGSDGNIISLRLHVTPQAICIAVLLGLLTVLISAWLPARRAMKIPPIDAIRQTQDIAIRPGKVKTSGLTLKLFRLPGMLASKNFKRNRRKYRATVLSLFVSIVLFISASSYCSYLTKGAEDVIQKSGYDIFYNYTNEEGTPSNDVLLKALSSEKGIKSAAYTQRVYSSAGVDKNDINPDYKAFYSNISTDMFQTDENGQVTQDAFLYFVNDEAYQSYLKEAGLPVSEYMDPENPRAVLLDFVRTYVSDRSKYSTYHILKENAAEVNFIQPIVPEGYYFNQRLTDEKGNETYRFVNEETKEIMTLPKSECTRQIPLQIGSIQKKAPFFIGEGYLNTLCILYPASFFDRVLGPDASDEKADYTTFYFTAEDHKDAYKKLSEKLTEMSVSNGDLHDYAESTESDRNMIMVINVFSYGFIILISLIAAANVFNTISTNINLRKREFAMLKSIGMDPRGFRNMMYYECLLYGIKGLLYGLPVSILMTWLIYRSISKGWDTSFYIPWHSLVIAIGSVFVVVFSTMIYSMKKVQKDNPMDALKNENL